RDSPHSAIISFAMWDILERTYLTPICQLKISWFSFQKTIASFCSLGGHGNSSNRNQMRMTLLRKSTQSKSLWQSSAMSAN
ncbi:hypothetical protein KXW65_007154, partial [Aspergillus fumigatus]